MATADQAIAMIRTRVLWLGPTDDLVERDYRSRNLSIAPCEGEVTPLMLAESAGVVFRFDSSKPGSFGQRITDVATAAIDHGLMLCAVASDDAEITQLVHVLRQRGVQDLV